MRRFSLVVGMLALVGCATPASVQRYTGDLVWSFETSAFTTDDGQGPWWLAGEGEAWRAVVAPLARGQRSPWGRLHLVIEGQLSPPGHYGQLGAYQRQLRVVRVIASSLAPATPQGS